MPLTPEEQARIDAAKAAGGAQDPANAVAAQPVAGQAPWTADLAARFADEDTRAAVDAFLRDTVQPHVTRLEQSAKPGQQAQELYDAFLADPQRTLLEVAEEVYDEDVAKAIAATVDSNFELDTTEPVAQVQPPAEHATLDPRIERLLQREQEQEERAAFLSEFERVSAANPDLNLDFDLFVPFVSKAGDFDQAVDQYKAWEDNARARFTPADPNAAVAPSAPTTLGSAEAAGTTVPPVQESYETVGDAIEAFAAELRDTGQSVAPPTPAPAQAA